MNKYNKGFSAIELILIVVVLAIVGTFVYFASGRKSTVDISNPKNTSSSQTTTKTDNTSKPAQATASSPRPVGLDKDTIIKYARQLSVEAESRYSGSYKKVLASNNIIKDNGAGILLTPGSVGAGIAEQVASKGGQIFVITNEKVTTYAIYGLIAGDSKTYYCLASDGSTKTGTAIVTDTAGLNKKPICK